MLCRECEGCLDAAELAARRPDAIGCAREEPTTNRIVITLDGGLVQNVENIPAGFEIEVRDFDTEGMEWGPDLTDFQGAGGEAFVSIWRPHEDPLTTDTG